MHLYKHTVDGQKWWGCPETRAEALEEARYYMWMNNPITAFSIIVALCASCDKKGQDIYDESLEDKYTTAYQRARQRQE